MQDNWNDITSYSRDDKERRPTIFELHLGRYFRVVICYSHIYYKNEWICSFYGALENVQLKMKSYDDLPKAKMAALKLAKQVLEPALAQLNKESAVTVAQQAQECQPG